MTLKLQIETIIKEEADKLIERYHEYHNCLELTSKSDKRRLGNLASKKIVHIPSYWSRDKKFNPFYVKKNYKAIAYSIAKRIENRSYSPKEPYIKKIPKACGGVRNVAIYQIHDAAVL